MPSDERSQKHEETRAALPPELRAVFDELVADYRFAAQQHYRQPFVSYIVLSELVKLGWRCAENCQKRT